MKSIKKTKKNPSRNPLTGLLPGEEKKGTAPGYKTFCVVCCEPIPEPVVLHGHNPYPLHDKGFACRTCNLEYILPKRLESL